MGTLRQGGGMGVAKAIKPWKTNQTIQNLSKTNYFLGKAYKTNIRDTTAGRVDGGSKIKQTLENQSNHSKPIQNQLLQRLTAHAAHPGGLVSGSSDIYISFVLYGNHFIIVPNIPNFTTE